jgi:autophagy-related protein 17
MSKTDDYPETLVKTISSIRHSLPKLSIPPVEFVEETLAAQDKRSTSMAIHLESLASHYDQMASALRESEAGEEFSDEDIHGTSTFCAFHKTILTLFGLIEI